MAGVFQHHTHSHHVDDAFSVFVAQAAGYIETVSMFFHATEAQFWYKLQSLLVPWYFRVEA